MLPLLIKLLLKGVIEVCLRVKLWSVFNTLWPKNQEDFEFITLLKLQMRVIIETKFSYIMVLPATNFGIIWQNFAKFDKKIA